jgi:trehalose 6-phosphate phosphatase
MRTAPFRQRIPAMFGDDATDEPAFACANGMGGLSVKIGRGPTCARHRLANPHHLRRLLARWAIEERFA